MATVAGERASDLPVRREAEEWPRASEQDPFLIPEQEPDEPEPDKQKPDKPPKQKDTAPAAQDNGPPPPPPSESGHGNGGGNGQGNGNGNGNGKEKGK